MSRFHSRLLRNPANGFSTLTVLNESPKQVQQLASRTAHGVRLSRHATYRVLTSLG